MRMYRSEITLTDTDSLVLQRHLELFIADKVLLYKKLR